jgi:hypothetical protein
MNPESAELLKDLTGTGHSGDFLVQALHSRRLRRSQVRIVAACALTMSALAILAACLSPGYSSPVAVTAPPVSFKLTENELLDSFSDQPVALVTWPDGRKQLLAIAHSAPARRE